MKIKYEYVNGDVVEVEAPDEIGEFIKESLKAEHADDERHRVHTLSLEGALYEGRDYGRYDPMLRRLEKQETKKDRTRKKAQLKGSLKKRLLETIRSSTQKNLDVCKWINYERNSRKRRCLS